MRRARTSDWGHVGWHYKAIHQLAAPMHNRLVIRQQGIEKLPARGGFLYAGNHTSWWDPIVLQTTAPRPVNWLAKKEMMSNAFNRWFFFDKGGCIPVDRAGKNPEAYALAVQALKDERVIGIFPEGTRYHGALGPAKTGVARLALEAGVPVVPVGIATDKFWAKGKKAPDLREPIYLNVGEPLWLKGDAHDHDDATRETQRVMDAIWALLVEARAARDAKAKWARAR
jgi:1-acyl-sn-glycerol-3-phosphate acyltransferase